MKRIYLLFALCLAVLVTYAQDSVGNSFTKKEVEEAVGKHPVTLNASVLIGANSVANHFLGAHEYSGAIYGLHVDFGRFFKDSRLENVSWKMSYDYLSSFEVTGGLENSAKTSSATCTSWNFNYSAFYNWSLSDALMVKAGAGVDLYGDYMNAMLYQTNNAISVNMLAQLEASAGISYVIDYDTWKLGLTGEIAIPFAGLVFTDSKHESGLGSLIPDGLMDTYDSHLKGSSFSNMQGLDLDLGVRFITPRVAYSVGIESDNRWWYVNDIQNYRMSFVLKFGVSFNLVSLEQTKTINRYF